MKNLSDGDIVIWNGNIGVVNSYHHGSGQFNVHFNDLNKTLLIHASDMIKAQNTDMEGQLLKSKEISAMSTSPPPSPSSSIVGGGIELFPNASKVLHRPAALNRRSSDSSLNYSNNYGGGTTGTTTTAATTKQPLKPNKPNRSIAVAVADDATMNSSTNNNNTNNSKVDIALLGESTNGLIRPASVNRIFSEPQINKINKLNRPSSSRDLSEPKLKMERKVHFSHEPIILNKCEFIPLPPPPSPRTTTTGTGLTATTTAVGLLAPRILVPINPENIVPILKRSSQSENSHHFETKLEQIKMSRMMRDKSKSFSESSSSSALTTTTTGGPIKHTQIRNSLSTVPILNNLMGFSSSSSSSSSNRPTKHSAQAAFSRIENLKHMGEDLDSATLMNTRKNAMVSKPNSTASRARSPPPSRREQTAATINSSYATSNGRVGSVRSSGYGVNKNSSSASSVTTTTTTSTTAAVTSVPMSSSPSAAALLSRSSQSIDRPQGDRYSAMHRALSPLSSENVGRGSSI
jgi:hypothetical protein